MRLCRTATRRKALGEEDEGRRDKERKISLNRRSSEDGGKRYSFVFLQTWHRNQVVQLGAREQREKEGEERHEEQEVDGKVIAVSTWSIACAVY